MKIIIPVSGGIDSAYLVAKALNEGHEVYPVHFKDYPSDEPICAEDIACYKVCEALLNRKPHVITCQDLDTLKVQYPIEHPHLSTPGLVYWSGYKALMYANTLAYGGAIGADEIWFGVYTWNDHFIDELPESAYKFQSTWASLYPELKTPSIKFPLIGSTKADIIPKALELGVPLSLTYSCFFEKEDPVHCGHCLGCKDRIDSFNKANVKDPAKFARMEVISDRYLIEERVRGLKVKVKDLITNNIYYDFLTNIVPESYYENLVTSQRTRNGMNLHPNRNSYSYLRFQDDIYQSQLPDKYWKEEEPLFLKRDKYVYPIVRLKDGNKGDSIVVTLGESSMLDEAQEFWLNGKELSFFGLKEKTKGCLETKPIDLANADLKRFARYAKKTLPKNIEVYFGLDYKTVQSDKETVANLGYNVSDLNPILCEKLLDNALPYALESWAHRGIVNSLGDNHIDCIVPKIMIKIGNSIGYFSESRDNMLYWDFSYTDRNQKNVGNTILWHACQIAKSLGYNYLDLGVAYFDWKELWTTLSRIHKGIELRDNHV